MGATSYVVRKNLFFCQGYNTVCVDPRGYTAVRLGFAQAWNIESNERRIVLADGMAGDALMSDAHRTGC